NKNYKTNSQKTIIGESLGGLLATEILLKKPSLFNDYIIISPSLWWSKESILSEAEESLKKNLNVETKVYVSVGNEGEQMQNDINKLLNIFQTVANKKLKTYYYPFPEENHATIMHRSVYKAFEVLNKKE
ncbi:MAG: alpha/beta hydrolase, partial [Bacteroidia bacterium]